MMRRLTRRHFSALAACLVVALTAACSSDPAPTDDSATNSASEAAGKFPVSVSHKFGVTTIDERPRRIVTVGYNDQDAVLALGVKPVASVTWFEDKVVYPWSQKAADAATGGTIKHISADQLESGGPEAIAKYRPDLIVAVFSYLTKSDYARYSKIAPTIVGSAKYPNDGTPWQEQTKLVGEALGEPARAAELVEKAEAQIAAIAKRNPEFQGKSAFAGAGLADGQVALYPTGRPGSTYQGGAYGPGYLLPALGFAIPKSFDKLGDSVTTPLLSYELINKLDVDLGLWTFPRDSDTAIELNKIPTYSLLDLVKQGREVYASKMVSMALNFSTVLSLPWAAKQLEPQLTAALDGDPSTTA